MFLHCIGTEVTEAPGNRLPLDPVAFWVIIGTAVAVVLTIFFVIFVVCCYCISYRARRKRYVFETGIVSNYIAPTAKNPLGTISYKDHCTCSMFMHIINHLSLRIEDHNNFLGNLSLQYSCILLSGFDVTQYFFILAI